jgi:gas vesicle protein
MTVTAFLIGMAFGGIAGFIGTLYLAKSNAMLQEALGLQKKP